MRYCIGILLLSVVFACKEDRVVNPVIPGGSRVVLLEEFTGKGCTNCPRGSREIDNLLALYDSNLVVVSIHAGFFANPMFFNLGQFDLRTPQGEEIFAMLGPNIGYPAGSINRTPFNGSFQHGANAWAAFIAEEIQQDPAVEFTMEVVYDENTRQAEIVVNGRTKADLEGQLRWSVMLTESEIVDAQDDFESGGIVEDYVHNHVLRTMATPFDGQTIANSLNLGDNFSGTASFTVDTAWVPEHCEVILALAFLPSDGSSISILQAGRRDLR